MIKNIFAIFIFSLLFVACSTNELSKQEKEVQRQEVSKELLSDISYRALLKIQLPSRNCVTPKKFLLTYQTYARRKFLLAPCFA